MKLSTEVQDVITFSLESNTDGALKKLMRNGNYPSVIKTETGVSCNGLNTLFNKQKNAFTITHPCGDMLYICQDVVTAQVLHKCALALAAAGQTVSAVQEFAAQHAATFSSHPYIKSTKPYSTKAANKAALIYLGFTEDQLTNGLTDYNSLGLDCYGIPVVSAHIYDSLAGHCCIDVNYGNYMAPVSTIEEIEEFSKWLDQHYPGWNN